ncbi:MAG: hypothetical protein K2H01_02335, partial [Ruminococcus sp.]|nr:hypothetical protein [Ruminococcus sp.]
MKKRRLMTLGLMGVCALSLVSCGGNKDNTPNTDEPGKNPPKYDLDNETTPLRLSSQELDGVFNPFFSTSGADSSVVSMTQIGMLSNDKDGNIAYGEDEPTVVLDYQEVETGSKDNDTLRTTYYFVLKNNVKFSNGSSLTMRDVLFNLYVYLDPAYTGSSTIYSTDIVGLKEYRTQQEVEGEQDSFMKQFSIEAETRIEDLVSAFEEIMEDNKGSMTEVKMKELLKDISDNASGDNRKHLVEDYDRAIELFKTELENDYTSSLDSYEDISFKKTDGTVIKPFETDIEAFLYNEGYIQYNKKEDSLTCSFGDLEDVRKWSKEDAIELIYADLIPYKLDQVVQYWSYTSTNLYQDLTNIAMEEYFQGSSSDIKYKNISGIQFANRTEPVTVNGKKYDIPVYDADGITPKAGSYEVLSITIKNIDPKAKWNFSFGVAPMYYYSDQEHISKFDYISNFGVEYGSSSFMTNVVKSSDKIGVPVGAGAYQAANSDGSTGDVTAGEFKKNNVISYVRNEYFVMGAPKIKNVHLQVIPQKNMMNAIDANEVDFVEPNAKPETVKELAEKKQAGQGIGYETITTMGYGYIGINAGQVPSRIVRQVIMHCINTQECVDYYSTQALAIHRSMSLASWAYPKGATPYYPYIGGAVPENLDVVNPLYADFVTERGYRAGEKLSAEDQEQFVRTMIEDIAGYSEDASGVYKKNNDKLQYIFT